MNMKPSPIALKVKCPTAFDNCPNCYLYAGQQGCQWYTFHHGICLVPRMDMGTEGIQFEKVRE